MESKLVKFLVTPLFSQGIPTLLFIEYEEQEEEISSQLMQICHTLYYLLTNYPTPDQPRLTLKGMTS